MAHGHPHGDPPPRGHRLGGRNTGRTRRNPSHTRPLPPPGHRRRRRYSTTARCSRAFGACLSRLPGKRARPVLRGPRRSNAPGLPDEIFFSILQRKVLTPNDLTDLDALTERVLAFQDRYNATATPFDWTFTRTDLDRLLDRIAAHEAAAPTQSTGLATA